MAEIKDSECEDILHCLIHEHNMQQKEIAKKCNIHPVTINRYLNGRSKPRLYNLNKIKNLYYEVHGEKSTKPKTKNKHNELKNDIRHNGSGYYDPTAFKAIKKVDSEYDKNGDRERLCKLLDVIFSVCDMADFHVEGRIILKDKRTGKIWR